MLEDMGGNLVKMLKRLGIKFLRDHRKIQEVLIKAISYPNYRKSFGFTNLLVEI